VGSGTQRWGCTYKWALSGWLGHDAPFAFEQSYRPAPDIERMRIGTPPVLQLAALEAALTVWDGVDMSEVRVASVTLSELFISEVVRRCPELKLASPQDPTQRGSHVSFSFEHGYAVVQALIDRDVIGDFRAPDLMRFGFTPLYLDESDVLRAVVTHRHRRTDQDEPETCRPGQTRRKATPIPFLFPVVLRQNQTH